MLEEILLLLTGAVIGVAAPRAWVTLKRRYRSGMQRRLRDKRVLQEESLYEVIPTAYARNGESSALHEPSNIVAPTPPVISDPSLLPASDILQLADFITIDDPTRVEFPVDHAVIRRKQASGIKLWDGDVTYLRKAVMEETSAGLVLQSLHVGVANYFAYVTAAHKFRTSAKSKKGDLTGSAYRDIRTLLSRPPEPLAIGVAAACVFHTDQGLRMPVALRSSEVVNAAGKLALLPTFGLEVNIFDGQTSRFDTLTYNFIKEFLEEVLGARELTRNADSGGFDPDQVFDTPQGRTLVAQFDQGHVTLEVLGVSAELTDGSLTISLLADFSNPDYYREVRRHAKANWEWSEAERFSFRSPDEFRGPAGSSLSNRLSPTSLITLDLALSRLDRSN